MKLLKNTDPLEVMPDLKISLFIYIVKEIKKKKHSHNPSYLGV
jgi:hypothetical protein